MIEVPEKRRRFARIRRIEWVTRVVLAAVGIVALSARAQPGSSAILHGRTDGRVRFSGDWVPVAAPDKMFGRYAERSDTKGASVELDFCGTSVGLVHQTGGLGWEWGVITPDTGRALGLAEVRIDGGIPFEVDTSYGGRTLLASGLPAGRHRVVLTNRGAARAPGGSGTIVVKGFWVDAGEVTDDRVRRAWLAADAVRGGEGWRVRAAEWAAAVKTAEDLRRLEALVAASRDLEALAEKLRAVTADPPASPMAERERCYWTPNRDTQAYLARLASLRKALDVPLEKADTFRYDEADRAAFTGVMTELRRGSERVDAFFQDEVRRLPPILFFTGAPLKSGAAPNHIWQSEPLDNIWGCSIRTWDPAHPDRPANILFEEDDSAIYDLNLSYDARTVFFSMRRGRAQCWQIYEMGTDGTGLRQITFGPHYNVSPVPLPDGRLAFISSRAPGTHTVCQSGPSTHVHVMNRDGSGVQDLSANTLSDFGLSIMADGRLIFTRWEYVDVTLTYRQSVWTQWQDGSQLLLWFGNTILDPATFWQAREIPGRYAAVCTFTSHHHSPYGAIGLVTNRNGPEAPRGTGFRWITREFPANLDLDTFWAYRDPFPIHENRYLVSYGGGGAQRFRIYLLDDMDNKVSVYEDPATSCFSPQPLRPRPVPSKLESAAVAKVAAFPVPAAPPGQPVATHVPLGRLMLTDVYRGLGPEVERGRVASIRIMEQMPKTVNRTWNFVFDQGPLMSASTYYAKRVWGYAPVEADGSAFFEAPALKELYLQACDAEGREVRRMTSVLQLMPGETLSCVGCHESRLSAAASGTVPIAARRVPTPLALPEWGNAGVLDYNRVVQPVLDRHCVRCHQGMNPPNGVILTGDFTRFFNMSYDHLVIRTRSEEASHARYTGRASEKPMVQSLHLLYGIIDPFPPFGSGSFASRLPEFLNKAHCQTEIPVADRRRVYEWIDAMIPYYPTSDYARMEAKSNRDKWAHPDRKELLPWFTERFAPVFNRRCAACHGEAKGELGLTEPRQWSWLNLTRPAWSPALNAHLAKSAGGRGIPAKGFMFQDTTDPDYQAMLAAITEGGKKAYETPEADMPGFINRSQHRAFIYQPVR